jgi:type VI protein secretion system component VasK
VFFGFVFVFVCVFVCILVTKKRKQRNKETKKQRNKETKKQRNKEKRNKETKKQRNKETKKKETKRVLARSHFFFVDRCFPFFVTPGAPKQNKKQKMLFIVCFQTDRKKRFSFRETLKRARPKTIATKKRG